MLKSCLIFCLNFVVFFFLQCTDWLNCKTVYICLTFLLSLKHLDPKIVPMRRSFYTIDCHLYNYEDNLSLFLNFVINIWIRRLLSKSKVYSNPIYAMPCNIDKNWMYKLFTGGGRGGGLPVVTSNLIDSKT